MPSDPVRVGGVAPQVNPKGSEDDMKAYIVCVGDNGRSVLFGRSETEPVPGQPMPPMVGVRMVLYWDAQCGGLFGLAAKGPRGDTRVTAPVAAHGNVDPVKQFIAVSDDAAAAFDGWRAA